MFVTNNAHNVETVQNWLSQNILKLPHFNMKACGKYLGLWIGPAAGARQWLAPMLKYKERVPAINAAKFTPILAVREYKVKVCTVLHYVA